MILNFIVLYHIMYYIFFYEIFLSMLTGVENTLQYTYNIYSMLTKLRILHH
jgi:hypothetical protein